MKFDIRYIIVCVLVFLLCDMCQGMKNLDGQTELAQRLLAGESVADLREPRPDVRDNPKSAQMLGLFHAIGIPSPTSVKQFLALGCNNTAYYDPTVILNRTEFSQDPLTLAYFNALHAKDSKDADQRYEVFRLLATQPSSIGSCPEYPLTHVEQVAVCCSCSGICCGTVHQTGSFLHHATQEDNRRMVAFLLDQKICAIDDRNHAGKTALFFVTTIEMANVLFDHGIDLNSPVLKIKLDRTGGVIGTSVRDSTRAVDVVPPAVATAIRAHRNFVEDRCCCPGVSVTSLIRKMTDFCMGV